MVLTLSQVNEYLAHKQHLLPSSRLTNVEQVTRDIVALHATISTSPYLSPWARVPDFQRQALEDALYERRVLVKVLCMRTTLHVVASDELPYFFHAAVERSLPPGFGGWESFLVWAGLCQEDEEKELLEDLHRRVLAVVAQKGPCTVQTISQAVPELRAKIRHDLGKSYEGEFSVGSRLVPRMCSLGLLVRARPRGGWRSSQYEYALLSEWLPAVDLKSVTPREARKWLVRRYLAAFGPATTGAVQWWTGFPNRDAQEALCALGSEIVPVAIQGADDEYLMLTDDAQRLREFTPANTPYIFLLPSLDPYIMGYKDRSRFLFSEHRSKVFDRAGNAVPTVWANGRLVGVWGQRKEDGSVIYHLFETVNAEAQKLLAIEAQRLEGFLGGEYLSIPFRTPFTRALA
ncbi:MAG: hypothetical protein A2Y73_07690 [Chloroflexi bacterium RBG_13_56_8]|nr:MAG: hypothetical protein A2Y73_07690 [Chloroflexi bacterium RBG_13_56_8]